MLHRNTYLHRTYTERELKGTMTKKTKLPLIAFIAGFGLVVWSISASGDIRGFIDIPSVVITLLGSFSALLMSFPMEVVRTIPKATLKLMEKPSVDYSNLIEEIIALNKKTKTDGILSLESEIEELENDLLRRGLRMVVDGESYEKIEEFMELETDMLYERHKEKQLFFDKWAEYAPAFGMIGTLVGLVAMLGDLQDPSLIGSGMATALLTTLYGSILANLIFTPIAQNLAGQTKKEMKTCDLITEAVLGFQAGDNPRTLEEKLKVYDVKRK